MWKFVGTVASADDKSDNFYFVSRIYERNAPLDAELYNLMLPLLYFLEKNITTHPLILLRIKANLFPRTPNLVEHETHQDYNRKGVKGFVFMLNSNDGFTRIGDKKAPSVRNTGVVFDSSDPHNSTTCTSTKVRMTINFNFW